MKRTPSTPLPPDNDPKFLGIFTKDRKFYRTFFPMLVIVALRSVVTLAVNLVDNIMLGRYTELALSGATLVNQIQFTLQQMASGIGMGIVVLAAQYWGKGQTGPIKKIISLGMKMGFAIGILFFALAQLIPETLLSLFTNDQEVIQEGMRYLSVICWTYLLFSISNSLMYALQSTEITGIGIVMSASTICINFCLNYCLIYGNFGFPELGVVGAAVATLVSRSVELIIILVYILVIDKRLRMKVSDLLSFDTTYLRDYIKTATPLVLSGVLWGVAQAAQAAVLGHINATVIAANSIASVVFQVFAVLGMASANVASVTIGKTLGEGRLDMVRSYAKTLQGIFILVGLISGGVIFLVKDVIVGFYAVSAETKEMALTFLTVLSVTAIGTSYEYPVEAGIIAGGGSTSYVAWADNLFMWLFTIPVAAISAFVFQFPPLITFCCLKADQILKCIPNGIVCNRFRWAKLLAREVSQDAADT